MEAMTSEREAFEAAVRQWPNYSERTLARDGRYPEYYGSPVVQGAWEGWKARAHLAQPAQAVDVGAIREVIADLREWGETDMQLAMRAATLTRALSGEKAGPVGDGWQPIETAPKDGTHIWLGATHEMRVGFWHQSWEHWVDYHAAESGSPRSLRFDPTAWQPLPASPTPGKEGEE